MTKAFIYLRVSTDDKGQNPRLQLHSCLELATRLFPQGFTHEVFTEEKSAWQSYNRPIFDSLIQRAIKEDVHDIIVWDLDRVYRDRVKMVSLVRELARKDIRIRSTRQQWLEQIQSIPAPWNTIIYDFLLSVVAWMAEEESQKKSERVKLAVTKKYGRTVSRDGKRWGRPELSSYFVKQIREMRKQGKSIGAIARELGKAENTIRKYIKK